MSKIPVQDHLGNWYSSKAKRAEHFHLPQRTIDDRLKNGLTLEEALTRPANRISNAIAVQDHLGNWYDSKTKRAEHYGLTAEIVDQRLKSGRTLEEALTTPAGEFKTTQRVQDHLGNWYDSKKERAEHFNLSTTTIDERLENGYSLEKALTTPAGGFSITKEVYDHLGNKYDSKTKRAEQYDVAATTVDKRLEDGLTLEEALTMKSRTSYITKDPDGKEWPSVNAMCRAHGARPNTFRHYIAKGDSVKDALEKAKADNGPTDWANRKYKNNQEMADRLHVKRNDMMGYIYRNNNDTKIATKMVCVKKWPGTNAGKYRIIECVSFPWFLCEDTTGDHDVPHSGEVILHADRILALKDQDKETAGRTKAS